MWLNICHDFIKFHFKLKTTQPWEEPKEKQKEKQIV